MTKRASGGPVRPGGRVLIPDGTCVFPPRAYQPEDRYETGYRDGENNRIADAQAYHEEALGHEESCDCSLAAFLRHVGAYDKATDDE